MLLPIGTEADVHERQTWPWVTLALLFLYTAVLTRTMAMGAAGREDVFYSFGMIRSDYHWWSALTCTALHGGVWGGLLHFAGNALFLALYGWRVEKLIGSARFALLYVIGAFASTNLHILTMSPLTADEPCIGASGAISAVLGCFFVMLPRARVRCLFFSIISFRPIQILIPAWLVLGLWLGGQLLCTLGIVGEIAGVAFWAHVAGFAVGAVVGSLFQIEVRRRERLWAADLNGPLEKAWEVLGKEHYAQAAAALAQVTEVHPQARSVHALLEGLVGLGQQSEAAGPLLMKAMAMARDYHDDSVMLTAYLQYRMGLPEQDLPASYHRDAGFRAARSPAQRLALNAFYMSLSEIGPERFGQMLRAIETVLARMGCDNESAELRRMIAQSE